MWTEKYRPSSLDQIVGNNQAIETLRSWAEDWIKGKNPKPILIHGPPGVGKTAAAHALAREMGWELVEFNASDQRTQEIVERLVGAASRSQGLGSALKLVVIDEVDHIDPRADHGGLEALNQILERSRQPLILIANDVYALPRYLRDRCQLLEFKRIHARDLVKLLARICNSEGIEYQQKALEIISKSSEGDARSAINDLQASVLNGKLDLDHLASARRNREKSVFEILSKIFKQASPKALQLALMDVDLSPEELVHWIAENVPRVYRDEDIKEGLSILSRSDQHLGRARSTGDYRLWKYASYLMSTGVQQSRSRDYPGFITFHAPEALQKLAQSKQQARSRQRSLQEFHAQGISELDLHLLSGYLESMRSSMPSRKQA